MSTMTSPWAKKATSGEGGGFEMPAGGSYPGCLVALIDLGTQAVSFGGETKDQHKVVLVFELTGEFDSKGETFKVIKDFTFSLNSKAKLRGFVDGWLGRKLADDETVDITQFVLAPCVVNVNEGTSANGKRFVDVASVTRPMKGLTVPPATVEPFVWSFEGHDPRNEPPVPEWVPMLYGRKVADDIKKSREWSTLTPF